MTFNSLSYFLFLPLSYLAFYFAPDRLRWAVLLVASYLFYASFMAPQILIALAIVTLLSYACGLWLGRTESEEGRLRIFWLGTAGCLLTLLALKYLPVLLISLHREPKNADLLISIGVSYFSLQAISYLADTYLQVLEPERHLGHHALALAFFPKLLQGPIERAGDLLPQLKSPYRFDYDAMRSGMLLFTWGLFKKLVVADRLALGVNTVYNDVHAYTGLPLLVATYAYALQIYFDFSGYTDMARGTARMFGVNLTENFASPYLASSIADFWRRWHISFSRWILDYIFTPLNFTWRGRGQAGTALALIVTFLASGVWHGASWGFLVWGLLHGIYLAASVYYRPVQKRIHRALGLGKSRWLAAWQVAVTFNLVCFAWIFFRAASLSDAIYVAGSVLDLRGSYAAVLRRGLVGYAASSLTMGMGSYELFAALSGLAVWLVASNSSALVQRPTWVRWGAYCSLVWSILFFGSFQENSFVYFQF